MARMSIAQRFEHSSTELLPLDSLTADGLLVRCDGAHVRALDVTPSNPLVLDEEGAERMTRGLCELLLRVPAGMSVQLYAQADPVDLEVLLDRCRDQTDAATQALIDDLTTVDQGEALRELAALHERSLAQHADGQAAVDLRFALLCPYLPPSDRPRRRRPKLPAEAKTERDRLARESLAHVDRLASALTGCELSARLLDGPAFADLLWRRIAPRTSRVLPGEAPSQRLDFATATAAEARAAIASAPVDLTGRRHVGLDGELEHVIYVSRPPARTFYGWLLHAMQAPAAWTISVHIHVTDRRAMQQRFARQATRLWGINTGARDAGRRPDRHQEAQEEELETLADELATGAETVCDLSVYQSLRHPDPDDHAALDALVAAAARDLAAPVDCGVGLGDFQQHALWRSTLPLGLDVGKRTWRALSRHAADTGPFVAAGAGSPGGIPFAFADPGRTVERLDPFDRAHDNATTLVFAKSGGGKTATVIHLASAAMPRGCQVHVIDRSTGHYAYLASLIPGAAHLELGGETGPAVNPWDTPDPANPPKSKVAFLVALHALLIGDAHDDGFGLSALERNLLALAIRHTYAHAADDGAVPCESRLRRSLLELADDEALQAGGHDAVATYPQRAARLGEFCGDGTYAHLFDRPTTIAADDAPLVVFNVRAVPDDLLTPVLFSVFEFVAGRVERRHAAHQAAGRPEGSMQGTSMLVLEELSELVRRPAAGAWINTQARRARHIGLWLVAISQQRADLAGDHGRALLDNSTIQLFLRQGPDDVAHVADALHLTAEEVAQISALRTEKGAFAQAYLINGNRGRGALTIRLSPELYWIATSDTHHDGPRRQAALREADGDPWAALDLLCDPTWQPA